MRHMMPFQNSTVYGIYNEMTFGVEGWFETEAEAYKYIKDMWGSTRLLHVFKSTPVELEEEE